MEQPILTINNLTKKFGYVTAVKDLSFTINKGNVYGILGPNGSGKSTTLGIVLNVVNKTNGDFHWFDGNTSTHDALKQVGAIIERPNFYPYMTAEENLKLVCRIKGVDHGKIAEKLEVVGLLDRKDHRFKTYSLGMKQRLAIASALLNDPEILILDEPTNGLDPQGIHQIRQIIKDIAANGTTILLASELKAENQDELIKLLETNSNFGNIKVEGDLITAFLNTPMSASDFNKLMFEKGILLSHLVQRKESLEEQFLQLTDNLETNQKTA